jgi:hypothetical protein
MTDAELHAFAGEWSAAWNAHDLTRILSHFSDDVTFTSPVATQLLPESGGIIHGKKMLTDYWREGLRRIPDLHFEVLNTYVGVNTLVINYRNQRGVLVNEVLEFDGDVVVRGHGTYAGDSSDPAGATSTS